MKSSLFQELSQRISNLQLQVLRGDDEQDAFNRMLELFLEIGESRFGFVAEVAESSPGKEALRIRAITNLATTQELQAMYMELISGDLFFEAGPNLIGELLRTRQTVIANDVMTDARKNTLPAGHPSIDRFMGIPLMRGNAMLGVVGLANRKTHYDDELIKVLEPLLVTCTTLLEVYRERRQRHAHELALAESRQDVDLMAAAFRSAQDGILITDQKGKILEVNNSFCRDSGYSRELLIGQNPRMLRSGKQSPDFYRLMWQTLSKKGQWVGELWNRRRSGEEYAVRLTIRAIAGDSNDILRYVGVSTDITNIKKHEEKLAWLVFHDEKTGLPNLRYITKQLSEQIRSLKPNEKLCVAYLDIDEFKLINERYGMDCGDRILKLAGEALQQELSPNDLFGRLTGDEFIAVLKNTSEQNFDLQLAAISNAVNTIQSEDFFQALTVSIGATVYPQYKSLDAEQLIRQADQAMYHAKLMGGNLIQYFDHSDERTQAFRHQQVIEIRQALNNEAFVLYYQPKVNMHTHEVVGAEALIRWQHPERGLLTPGAFLPMIENDPVIESIGAWVLHTALCQLSVWSKKGQRIPVSINISPRELHNPEFISNIANALAMHPDVEPNLLQLEVLETSALEDIERVSKVINQCRKFGIEFAIDDFGTGYSSLTYLKHLPVNVIKIDQSFVRNLTHDPSDQAILKSIVDLAKVLGRDVIAEGVETQAHVELLKTLGCHLGQGYAIGHPMSIGGYEKWLMQWQEENYMHGK
ncbi:putative bifunctional diguanylate cyclase/phosphodiesterase [Nitrincola sp. A-D6]|uniref:putative bifunctional diguanylate cyclase/phosphodiesterase n=1 Tax=Nitrincola sp. A-D6 TaxID=1545442 RepID=UPI001184E5E1|nr:EAL domain-containing protein [Nitrincola sp. A-D6]